MDGWDLVCLGRKGSAGKRLPFLDLTWIGVGKQLRTVIIIINIYVNVKLIFIVKMGKN